MRVCGEAGWVGRQSIVKIAVYLDNFDVLEKVDSRTAERIQEGETPPPLVEALREAYRRLQAAGPQASKEGRSKVN